MRHSTGTNAPKIKLIGMKTASFHDDVSVSSFSIVEVAGETGSLVEEVGGGDETVVVGAFLTVERSRSVVAIVE